MQFVKLLAARSLRGAQAARTHSENFLVTYSDLPQNYPCTIYDISQQNQPIMA